MRAADRHGESLRRGILRGLLCAIALCGCDRHDDPDPASPAPPTGLSAAAAGNARIDLSWTDNASSEQGFIVEQSSDGVNFTPVDVAPADAATAAVTGLAPSTTYTFRVRAYGYRTASAWSNPAAATTAAVGWTLLSTGTPPERIDHSAAYDSINQRMIVFAGVGEDSYSDTWALDLSQRPVAWSDITPPSSPAWRSMHGAACDADNRRMIVFGGVDDDFPATNGVLVLDLSGTPAWNQLLPPDSSPATPCSRYGHSLIHDAPRQRLILFGGNDGSGSGMNDVWALNLSGTPAWTRLTTVGTPPSPRYSHAAIHDTHGDRMIVFGGNDGSPHANDTWALSLSGAPVWTKLTPAGMPPSARLGHTAIYDAAQRRLFVFGGSDGYSVLNDLWVLTLSGPLEWHPVFAGGTLPSPRISHTTVYDSVRQEMILFGGWDDAGTLNCEAWSLGL